MYESEAVCDEEDEFLVEFAQSLDLAEDEADGGVEVSEVRGDVGTAVSENLPYVLCGEVDVVDDVLDAVDGGLDVVDCAVDADDGVVDGDEEVLDVEDAGVD